MIILTRLVGTKGGLFKVTFAVFFSEQMQREINARQIETAEVTEQRLGFQVEAAKAANMRVNIDESIFRPTKVTTFLRLCDLASLS